MRIIPWFYSTVANFVCTGINENALLLLHSRSFKLISPIQTRGGPNVKYLGPFHLFFTLWRQRITPHPAVISKRCVTSRYQVCENFY
jgi:hypothetical protein